MSKEADRQLGKLQRFGRHMLNNRMGPWAVLFLFIWFFLPLSFGLYGFSNDFYNVLMHKNENMITSDNEPTIELLGLHIIIGFIIAYLILWSDNLSKYNS